MQKHPTEKWDAFFLQIQFQTTLMKWNSSKVGQCVALKKRRYRFNSYLFHNVTL